MPATWSSRSPSALSPPWCWPGRFAFDQGVLDPIRENARESQVARAVEDAANEFFSDGVAEELLNLLAKIPELRVISRTSAFWYKGKDVRLNQIAAELDVAHVLEGSVRKSGDRVRITAQLIDARSDSRLWSETFDRRLDDIFAIQEEIASAVAQRLKLSLLVDFARPRPTDPGLADIVAEPLFAKLHADARWLPFRESIARAPAQLDAIGFAVRLPRS